MVEDAIAACLDEVVASSGGPAWGPEEFEALVSAVRRQVGPSAKKAVQAAVRITYKLQSLGRRTGSWRAMADAGAPGVAAALATSVNSWPASSAPVS